MNGGFHYLFCSAVIGEGSGVKFESAVATPPAADSKVKTLCNVLCSYLCFPFLGFVIYALFNFA